MIIVAAICLGRQAEKASFNRWPYFSRLLLWDNSPVEEPAELKGTMVSCSQRIAKPLWPWMWLGCVGGALKPVEPPSGWWIMMKHSWWDPEKWFYVFFFMHPIIDDINILIYIYMPSIVKICCGSFMVFLVLYLAIPLGFLGCGEIKNWCRTKQSWISILTWG